MAHSGRKRRPTKKRGTARPKRKTPDASGRTPPEGEPWTQLERARLTQDPEWQRLVQKQLRGAQRQKTKKTRPRKSTPWGFRHIERYKLITLRTLCGRKEFKEWLTQREQSAEVSHDYNAIIELVSLDLAYAARFKSTLDVWQEWAAAGSKLAEGWLREALIPSARKKDAPIPFKVELIRDIHQEVLSEGFRGRDALKETARRVFDMTGEFYGPDNLRENILYSRTKPLTVARHQPYEILQDLASMFPMDYTMPLFNLSLLRDSCERCKFRIPDWDRWKDSKHFRTFKSQFLEHFTVVFPTENPRRAFLKMISSHDKLATREPPPNPSHCRLLLRGYVPCPYTTEITRAKRKTSLIREFIHNYRQLLAKIPEPYRPQWIKSL